MEKPDLSQDIFNPGEQKNLFETYQLLIEMADRVSSRRMNANSFFLTLNTGIMTILVSMLAHNHVNYLWVLNILALFVNWTWLNHIKSSKLLNGAKFKIIQALETKLATNAYTVEWNLLTKDPLCCRYKRLSLIESWIPTAFLVFYSLGFILTIYLHLWR